MDRSFVKKTLYAALVLLGLWLGVTYLLPVALPFLLGLLLALAAEPFVRLAGLKLRRSWAAGLGVTVTLVLLVGVTVLLGSAAVREISLLTGQLPDVRAAAQKGMEQLQLWLDTAVQRSPESIRGLLQQTVNTSFKDGTVLMNQVTDKLPGALTGVLGWIPKGTLSVFTGILSAFMISARLPRLKAALQNRLPASWHETYLPALRHLRHGLWGWLKAQLKLMVITFAVVGLGLSVLGVDRGILWGGLIAVVDAVPVLGTGTALIPWAVISFLQDKVVFGIGLLAVYFIAVTLRTVLEPRLVGRHLGLDPLLTLVAFYAGYKLFGFVGMLLSPVLAAALATVLKKDGRIAD